MIIFRLYCGEDVFVFVFVFVVVCLVLVARRVVPRLPLVVFLFVLLRERVLVRACPVFVLVRVVVCVCVVVCDWFVLCAEIPATEVIAKIKQNNIAESVLVTFIFYSCLSNSVQLDCTQTITSQAMCQPF